MYREITIGKESIPMKATGATPIRYRMVFKGDLLNEFSKVNDNYQVAIDTISQLAFIMAMTAKSKDGKQDLSKLNLNLYMEWLEQFDPMDLPMASEQIVNLYLGNTVTSSEPKKKEKENQSEK